MMKYRLGILTILAVLAVFATSCKSKGRGVSSTTGWSYNDPTNGGFEVKEGVEQETGPGLVYIEGGAVTIGNQTDDITYDWNNKTRKVTVESFYMDQTEVRNVDYREYLFWIQRVFSSQYPEVYRKALPDTLVWLSKLGFNDPYVENYLRHPSYNEYPVVGVNWLQANDYAAWRSDRVNENILVQQGILELDANQSGENNFNTDAYLAGQYIGTVKKNLPSVNPNNPERAVQMEDGILLPKYRLPTEAEWEYAALGLIGNSVDERTYEKRVYPWNGHNVRNDQKKERGKMRANFVRGRGDMMGMAGALNDGNSITGPVTFNLPNDYGLYCMAGNVNEWVLDVYRPLSFEDVDEFRPFRGNVFQTLERNQDGTLVQKDSLGRLKKTNLTTEEATKKWRRVGQADYKNYADGDYASSVEYTNSDANKGPGSQRMYSQKPSDMSSLINDNVRVYKGGSWRDRAYWLSPGTRRFLQEDQSKDDLGFRCAMTRVGAPQGNKR